MSDFLLYCIGTTVASTVVSATLATLWAKSRSQFRYVLSMAVAWIAVSTLPLTARTWEVATFPADLKHFVATMIWSLPFVVAPMVGLCQLISDSAPRKKILLGSIVASMVALPISFFSGIYAACSLGDCL